MKITRYFREEVLIKRPYIKIEWCEAVLAVPIAKVIQSDNRIRYWGKISEMDNKILRVVTLEDGETVHNAFFDRNFKETI